MYRSISRALFLLVILATGAFGQTTEFTYQGSLQNSGTPANGNFDFEFRLYDAAAGGNQIGLTVVARNNVAVTNGIFSVAIDFGGIGPNFPGADRYLDIRVGTAGGGSFTPLTPRGRVNSTPYAIQSLNAATATNATTATNAAQLGGVAANQYVITTDPRMTDARSPTAGSGNYVQNATTPQATSNFNISGNGTAGGTLSGGIVNAITQYNIGGTRILGTDALNNLFVGLGSGSSNTFGSANSFFGRFTGEANTTGDGNSFFGTSAGLSNATGDNNTFVGFSAGTSNTTANDNSFFGVSAGTSNTTGSDNAFFGRNAGFANTTGGGNSFFGRSAGRSTTFGDANSFFGNNAGESNTSGRFNSFFGAAVGRSNTSGIENSFFGSFAGDSNTTGERNAFFGIAAGAENTTANGNAFFGHSSGERNTIGTGNAFVGTNSGRVNTSGNSNTFVGYDSGSATTVGDNNTVLGRGAGSVNTVGNDNTLIGYNAEVGSNSLSFATAIGSGAVVASSNRIQLGRQDGSDDVRVSGNLLLVTLGGAGATALCRNLFQQVSTCSSSLRYKTNLSRYGMGLNIINKLKPITFDWRDGGMHDLGLGAEDVAAIEPLLVTYNSKGEVEGVKYDRIGVVLINAVKEQQSQIERQREQIELLIKANQELLKRIQDVERELPKGLKKDR